MIFKKTERKYFRQPQETNLLTWAAKEQLKYLHESDSETWTPEILSQSFPISIEGVKRLLKSNFRPETEEDVAKHDQVVLKHWKQMKQPKQGPISTAVGNQFSTDKLDFESLDGNRKLPMPTTEWKSQHVIPPAAEVNVINLPVGEFGAIWKNYLTVAKKSETNKVANERTNFSSMSDVEVSLMATTKRTIKAGLNKSTQVSFEEFKKTMRENVKKFKKSDPVIYEKFNQYMEEREKSEKSKSKRHIRDGYEEEDDILQFLDGNIQKFKDDSEESMGLRWDTPRTEKDMRYQEAYLYSPKTGYQRPYGRNDKTDKVEIPANRRVDGAVWKKGNCYYDEDGDLLYRVPFAENSDK